MHSVEAELHMMNLLVDTADTVVDNVNMQLDTGVGVGCSFWHRFWHQRTTKLQSKVTAAAVASGGNLRMGPRLNNITLYALQHVVNEISKFATRELSSIKVTDQHTGSFQNVCSFTRTWPPGNGIRGCL
jgi:hypothetical protein